MRYCFLIMTIALAASAENWPRFRGPHGRGSAPHCQPPIRWSATENIAWKTALPGPGGSSPVIWGERIFLTCYTGVDRQDKAQRGKPTALKLLVVCLAADDGAILWQREFPASEHQSSGDVIRYHGYAGHTPTVDAERVYAFFGTTGVLALDHDGKEIWRFSEVGTGTRGWGTAASPILAGDLLVVPAQIESRTLYVLNRKTGKLVSEIKDNASSWDGFQWGYSTPAVTKVDGADQLVIGIMNGVAGYDLQTGKELWSYYYQEKGKGHSYPSSSPIIVDDTVYFSIANSHRADDTMAIRLPATGELKKSDRNLLFHINHGAYVSGPVYRDGRLFFCFFGTKGLRKSHGFFCIDAETGELVYQEPENRDKHPKIVYASALLAGDRIYYQSVSRGTYVVAASDKFELLAHNLIEDDDTSFLASPTPLGRNQLLLRSDRSLYCVGGTESAKTTATKQKESHE